jgi:hypothetical protein
MTREDIKVGDIVNYDNNIMLVGEPVKDGWDVPFMYTICESRELNICAGKYLFTLDRLSEAAEGQINHLHSLMVRDDYATHASLNSWLHSTDAYEIF